MNNPKVNLVKERFGDSPLLFELIPPEVDAPGETVQKRHDKVKKLFSRVDVNALNIPEIREESAKDEDGKRRSDFKPRVSPRSYVQQLREIFDTKYLICRVVVHLPPEKQEKWLIETNEKFGINNIVLVGGEKEADAYDGLSVPEGDKLIKEKLNRGQTRHEEKDIDPTDYLIGNISIASRRLDTLDEPDRITYKIKHGADFFYTQIIAEPDSPVELLQDLAPKLEDENIDPPVFFWSFAPIASQKDVDFMRWLGVKIPEEVEDRILGSSNPVEESIKWNLEIWEELNRVNNKLPVSCPLGVNISFMGDRNFDNAIALAEAFQEKF
ncbi:MAG: hypothetical protein ACQEP7_04420 [bacterium]